MAQALIGESNGQKKTSSHQDSYQRFNPGKARGKKRSSKSYNYPCQRKDIGNYKSVKINECDNDQYGSKYEFNEKLRVKAVSAEEKERRETGYSFHDWVAYGNRGSAMAAFPQEHEVAKKRNIIVRRHGPVTLRAVRTGANQRFALRKTINHHIVKAAEATPQDKHRRLEHHKRGKAEHYRLPSIVCFSVHFLILAHLIAAGAVGAYQFHIASLRFFLRENG
jgi:hypothetical protein